MTKRMMTVPCFPCTVCPDDGGYLSWFHYEGKEEEVWLECPKCHRIWQAEEIGYSVQDQFKVVGGMMGEVQDLTDIALSRLEEPRPSLTTRMKRGVLGFFML